MAIHDISRYALTWFHKSDTGKIILSTAANETKLIEVKTAAEFTAIAEVLKLNNVKYDDENEEVFSHS